ncbi:MULTISPECIES: DUF177 domain-containing protein [unclassified Mameliella]|uniref:YceD family protein n=1 Tax=unclassified Mameliella TaxID=2630630 RepID=UPI00274009CD|nr:MULTISPECIES: DUF177 domain-containing protein [unclassified Mameliella]
MTTDKPDGSPTPARLRVSGLRQTGPTPFRLEPGPEARATHAAELGAQSLRKLRFTGQLTPLGKYGWRLEGDLGATAVQSCIVTLDPVTTRIDTQVVREFLPPERIAQPEAGTETEMPEDDSVEELGDEIDLEAVMLEALSLALPTYPRKDGVELGEAQFAAEGVTPMTDEDSKPFAGLADLREKMQKKGEDD